MKLHIREESCKILLYDKTADSIVNSVVGGIAEAIFMDKFFQNKETG